MHLKSLTLRGFKSFADKTILRFEPGVTVIVGPNGSGKSNLTDAILWVLGEQSPRSLRGQTMEDVIFTGSSSRPALGIAEVALTLDNSDGRLPIEFSEIVIGRRVCRSGESEYRLNGAPCRLVEIQDLLSDTGLGRGLYSVIAQGKLEEVLTAKPEERRVLIEEAAGVLKHKKRRERVLRRLVVSDRHLVRAKDIHQEVTRRLKPLQTQAERARSYANLSAEDRELELALSVFELRALQGEWSELEAAASKGEGELNHLREETEKNSAATGGLQRQLDAERSEEGDIATLSMRVQGLAERVRALGPLLGAKRDALLRARGDWAERMEAVNAERRRLAVEFDGLQQEKHKVDEALTGAYADLGGARRAAEVARKRRHADDQALLSKERKIEAERAALEARGRALTELRIATQSLETKSELDAARLKSLAERDSELAARLTEKKRAAATLAKRLASLEGQLEKIEAGSAARLEEVERSRVKQADLERRLAVGEERLATLQRALSSVPGVEAVKRAVEAGELADIVGLLKDMIRVEPRYERAIEAALGADVHCFLLEESRAVQAAIDVARGADGQTVFLALDAARESGTLPLPEGATGVFRLTEVIDCDPVALGAAQALLSNVLVADDLKAARRLAGLGFHCATLAGEMVHPSGKVTIGGVAERVLEKSRAAAKLSDSVRKLAGAIEREKVRRAKLAAELDAVGEKRSRLISAIEALKSDHATVTTVAGSIEEELAHVRGQSEDLKARRPEAEAALKARLSHIGEEERSIGVARDALREISGDVAELRARRDASLRSEAEAISVLGEYQARLSALIERQTGSKGRETELSGRIAQLDGETQQWDLRTRSIETALERLVQLRTSASMLLTAVAGTKARIERLAVTERGSSSVLREKLRELNEERTALQARAERTREALHAVEIRKAQLEPRVSAIVDKIVHELDVPLEQAVERDFTVTKDDAQVRRAEIKRKLAVLGPVNPIAVQEYETLEERQQFFAKQIEDLTASRKAINKVTKAVDAKIKERFAAAFEQVAAHFQTIFNFLFPGGHAELLLVENEEGEAGVEILAEPGGKKLGRLSLLSGGERSLIALAFLFATYETRPSPFYMLDEVEASLDEVNLARFLSLVKQRRVGEQFIIVTHQRRSMEMAEALYGVTMQPDGISTLISQRLGEYTGESGGLVEPGEVPTPVVP